ncbi:uncharacterized protein Z518_05372 [Rhinocladiella mackenziei CBS 650.93]|uniref:AB hydrolase-1 domain-containing protein n=1 Tax=Rhinocladiella mackenziei CBS 650.93 TaxID=1442369 RepID=A0A0D2FQS1_9EURO|nr:uncharacterized protein Z518_05372 [Rhinocladiella mackenziei CBS 650.93]KIX04502.1 hypothetical protein Z518_05372 [Rhinocladiella mackenziei CBS 650.93]
MVQSPVSNSNKPSIVVVPGSFSPASFYIPIVNKLRENGYEAMVENLPSASRSPPEAPATMEEDAAFFHDVFEKLADQGKDVVVVTHSYGGVPGTEATRGLAKAERAEAGKPGGISRLVYLTSVVPPPGNSLQDLMGDLVPSFIQFEGEFMKHVIEESAKLTFSDLPFEEAVEWVKKMPFHSGPSFTGKLTYPGYKYIPVSFIQCEKDVILPPEFQNSVIETIQKESGNPVDLHTLATGHCPNASAPNDVAKIIMIAVAAA